MQHSGGTYRPRPSSPSRASEWADQTYDLFRRDADLAADIARHNPDLAPHDVERALQHVLHDEHILGTAYGDPWVGRFDASEDMAEAFVRLRSGEGTDLDRLLLRHEIEESAYARAHPGSTYEDAHAAANQVANWEKRLRESRGE